MEFFDILEKRYSMRGFEDKEVEKEKLDKILEAARPELISSLSKLLSLM